MACGKKGREQVSEKERERDAPRKRDGTNLFVLNGLLNFLKGRLRSREKSEELFETSKRRRLLLMLTVLDESTTLLFLGLELLLLLLLMLDEIGVVKFLRREKMEKSQHKLVGRKNGRNERDDSPPASASRRRRLSSSPPPPSSASPSPSPA